MVHDSCSVGHIVSQCWQVAIIFPNALSPTDLATSTQIMVFGKQKNISHPYNYTTLGLNIPSFNKIYFISCKELKSRIFLGEIIGLEML